MPQDEPSQPWVKALGEGRSKSLGLQIKLSRSGPKLKLSVFGSNVEPNQPKSKVERNCLGPKVKLSCLGRKSSRVGSGPV